MVLLAEAESLCGQLVAVVVVVVAGDWVELRGEEDEVGDGEEVGKEDGRRSGRRVVEWADAGSVLTMGRVGEEVEETRSIKTRLLNPHYLAQWRKGQKFSAAIFL